MTTPKPGPLAEGLLLIDKPAAWTSHDVVARVRRILHTKKVGHAGTLDPMATGLLVVGVGRATKLLTYLVGHDKAYDATIRLGEATITDDADGDVTARRDASGVSGEDITGGIAGLSGGILQRPSSVSAIKVGGERAYARVRGGEDVTLDARPVTVRWEQVGDPRSGDGVADLDVTVCVSSGTYVRALARDLGEALGVGGHLIALRRTRVGPFMVDGALSIEDLEGRVERGEPLPVQPLGVAAAAALATVSVTASEAIDLGYGKAIPGRAPTRAVEGAAALSSTAASTSASGHVIAMASDGTAVAILNPRGDALWPVVVFEPSGMRRAGE